MKKYNNVLLSLGFFILAPVWVFLMGYVFKFSPFDLYGLFLWPYIFFFITGVFFGFKNRAETPTVLGNIILIIGIIALSIPLLYFYWAAGWSA
jgi:hypothetical protein